MARPKKPLTKKQIESLSRMAGQGLTNEQMGAIFCMSKKTFERRMKDTPGGFDALEKGRAQAGDRVSQTAFDMAVSGQSPAMTMFWLKCRLRWREVQALEVSGPDGGPIKHASDLTDDQLDARIRAMTGKAGPADPKGA